MGILGNSRGLKTLAMIVGLTGLALPAYAQVDSGRKSIVLGAEAATGTTGTTKKKESNSNAASALSSIFSGQNRGGNKKSMMFSGGDCNTSPNPAMISQFNSCKQAGPTVAATKNSFVVDADNKVAFVLDPSGNVLKCVPITLGAASTGNPVTLGREKNQTRQGMFYAQTHNGERYQTNASDPGRDAIGFGDSSGRVIHSSHGNRTTAGCIGIAGVPDTAANADANFLQIKNLLGTDGGAIFVYGSNYGECGNNGDTLNGMSSRFQNNGGGRTSPAFNGIR